MKNYLESVSYVFLHLIITLPWMSNAIKQMQQEAQFCMMLGNFELLADLLGAIEVSKKSLCQNPADIPKSALALLHYCSQLQPGEKADYDYARRLVSR